MTTERWCNYKMKPDITSSAIILLCTSVIWYLTVGGEPKNKKETIIIYSKIIIIILKLQCAIDKRVDGRRPNSNWIALPNVEGGDGWEGIGCDVERESGKVGGTCGVECWSRISSKIYRLVLSVSTFGVLLGWNGWVAELYSFTFWEKKSLPHWRLYAHDGLRRNELIDEREVEATDADEICSERVNDLPSSLFLSGLYFPPDTFIKGIS